MMARVKQIASGEIEIKCRRCKKKFKFNFPMRQQQLDEIANQQREAHDLRAW